MNNQIKSVESKTTINANTGSAKNHVVELGKATTLTLGSSGHACEHHGKPYGTIHANQFMQK